ncbi:MAG: DUF99 family protein [Candidatus Marsarchaeota archaeon]|nr:DUF99 family protein [Candidatus Marsarchaeota archaeon]
MKSGARVLAVASGPIYERKQKTTILVGIVGRSNEIEGVLSERVEIDGEDSTAKIMRMFGKSRFKEQVKAIAINGIAIAGLNVVDIKAIEAKLHVPVIVMTRGRPRQKLLVGALEKAPDIEGKQKRILLVKETNSERKFAHVGGFYIQSAIEIKDILKVSKTCFELLRLAHLIAKGVSTGVSSGRV